MIVFQAKMKSTGETRTFTFNDLYGYEGEVCAVVIEANDTTKHLSRGGNWVLCYNKDSKILCDGPTRPAPAGLNPDLEITVLHTDG